MSNDESRKPDKSRILIVEDEAISGLELQRLLIQLGYDASAMASSGEDARRLSREMRPDLVLMDISLEGTMSGIEAADAIWAVQRVPVIFITAHADVATIGNAKVSEPYGFITKPYNANTLRSTIEIALYKSRSDARIQESEERLRFHLDNSPLAIIEWDAAFRVTRWTGAAELMFGWSAKEALGKSAARLRMVHEDDLPNVKNIMQRLASGELTRDSASNRNYTKQGKLIYCEWFNSARRDRGKTPASILSNVLNVTGRHLAKEQLAASEARYRRITDSLTDYQYSVRVLNGRAVETRHSSNCDIITGYTPAEFAADPLLWIRMVAPEDRERVSEHMTRIMTGAPVPPLNHRIIRKDGGLRWVNNATVLHKNDAGMLLSYDGVIRDITERIEAENALRKSEERNRTILMTAMDGFNVVDMKGRLLEVNKAYCAMSGYSMEELLNLRLQDLEVLETDADVQAHIQMIMSQGEHRFESRHRRKDGSVIDVEISVVYRPFDGGHFVSFIRDITARKRTERALSEKNAELERLTYTISHDLKSPLITFQTYLGYLERDLAAEHKHDMNITEDLGFMKNAADQMESRLGGILELSRAGRTTDVSAPVGFRELVAEALASVAGRITRRQVQVRVDDPDPTLFGDRRGFTALWQNLIDNAVKYMGGQKSPCVEIGVERTGPDTIFFVRDNGIGIDPRHQDRVFGLFDKLDLKSEGSGLGLALVKRIVEKNGGEIWIESAGFGRGTCFRFTLPEALKGND